MKNIKRILICLLVTLITTFNVQAEVKEDAINYTEDMYIIGSTRFTSDYTITSSRAATAGADEVFVQYNVFGNFGYRGNNIKTYYYCATDESWNEIQSNGSGVKELTNDEMQKVVENLDIFYVNNVEKTLEIPFSEPVDENSIIGPNDGNAKVENNKIIVPATWINGFAFTSNGANVEVEMGLGEEEGKLDEYKDPIIKMDPRLNVTLPSEVLANSNFEFSLVIKANGNEGTSVNTLGVFTSTVPGNVIDSLEYYDEDTSTWKEISNMGDAFGNKIQDVTIKYRVHLLNTISGDVKLNVSLVTNDNKSYTANASMNVKSVVTVNNKNYGDLALAFNENPDGTLKLLDDVSISKPIILKSNIITLDLNGKTLYFAQNGAKLRVGSNTNLTVKNGTVIGKDYALQAEDNGTLTVNNDANIVLDDTSITKNKYGITIWDNAVVNFAGNIVVTGDSIGISGNGNDKTVHSTINVTGGSIKVEDGVGIYQPNYGNTKISGGSITAGTVINIKAGSLNISNGEFNAVGVKGDPTATTGKTNPTGDVIIIEENKNYADNIKVNVTGGTFNSKNGYIIQEYNPTIGTNNVLTSVVTGKYSTKHIINKNNAVEVSYYDDKEAGVLVTENGVTNNYDSSDLFALLNIADNVKLLKDVETSETITLNTKKVTLDLNGKTLSFTKAGAKLRIRYNTDLTVKNGIINGMDYTLQPEDDSTLTVEKDVNIILDDRSIVKNKYGIAYWDKSTVNFEGNIVVTGDSIGISGNGGVSNTGKLNITGGSITANEGAGLYLPNNGTTKISGGTITAGTVLNIKAGSLDISDGTFKATGEKVSPNASNGQNNNTGDVIIIEENPSYQDHIKLNIVGGTFESTNGYIVQEYNPTIGTDKELTSVITGKYIKQNKIDDKTFYYTEE